MNLTLVVPTHNRINDVKSLINSLALQELNELKVELIVVSNLYDFSLEQSLKKMQRKCCFPIHYSWVGKVGVNAARNLGIKKSLSKKIYFLDDDVVIQKKNHLSELYEISKKNPQFAAIGGGYNLPSNAKVIDQVYHAICMSWLRETQQMIGGNTLYNLEILKEKLRFNEDILFGGSETELNIKLSANGAQFLFLETLNLEHFTRLSVFLLCMKAMRQGMGRSLHEKFVPSSFWKVNTLASQVFVDKIPHTKKQQIHARTYFILYDFFFHVGYRHGKRQHDGPLSIWAALICCFQTFFQINSEKLFSVVNPNDLPFHKQVYPSLKFKEIHHWLKGNIWWKVPNYVFWQFIPFIGSLLIYSINLFFPFNTIGLRIPYNDFFDKIEKKLKRTN